MNNPDSIKNWVLEPKKIHEEIHNEGTPATNMFYYFYFF